ncbi:histidine kinase [uncultured Psychroserpens sp.]|uniref:sensor histidine kinase n=1 Tax=uncultured Psychroserpens sp. TaxID=255436 RepID=UPI002630195A|nr:histidine kinase [uncultured Psychroserpens sp.]
MIDIKMNWFYRIIIHLVLSVVLFYFVFSLGSTYIYTFGHFNLDNALANVSFKKYMSEIDEIFLIYFTLLGIIHGYFYLKKIKIIKAQESQIQIDLMNSRLNVLKAQLQPIFIFNTLDSISNLIETNEEKSQNLIADFGELFREIIESKDENLIPLRKEWEFLNKFISIAKLRYSEDVEFRMKLDHEIMDVLVPSLMLQPLVEYDLGFYRFKPKDKLELALDVSEVDNERIKMHIQINGKLKEDANLDTSNNNPVLRNIKDRLSALYNDNFEFSMIRDNNIIITTLMIPRIYD